MAKKTAKKRTTARKKAPLEVEYVPIAQLKPFKGNPRKNADAVPEIVRSIEHYGYTNPILVRRENNEVIAGHTRLLALKETGAAEAPVIFLDMTAKQARAYGIFDNKSTENTEWDVPKLATLLEQLSADGIDLDKMGFTDEEFAAMNQTFDVGDLSPGNRSPFRQMTFTLHDDQVVIIKNAIEKAKAKGEFKDSPNENSNGNALTRIAEAYCAGRTKKSKKKSV